MEDPVRNGGVELAHTNSITQDATEEYPNCNLYELELNNVKTIADSCALDENLFHRGDTFTITDDMFNSKTGTNYRITVTGLSYTEATLKIDKIETTQD